MFELLKEAFHQLSDIKGLIEWGGPILVCAIVFVETGLFVGFFLPGDSILVTAGVFAASGRIKLAMLLTFVSICAVAGDQVGYWIGRRAGQALYKKKDSALFKKRHLERAREFYSKYGGKTIVIARFIPIIRTFAPPVAGGTKRATRPLGRDRMKESYGQDAQQSEFLPSDVQQSGVLGWQANSLR